MVIEPAAERYAGPRLGRPGRRAVAASSGPGVTETGTRQGDVVGHTEQVNFASVTLINPLMLLKFTAMYFETIQVVPNRNRTHVGDYCRYSDAMARMSI